VGFDIWYLSFWFLLMSKKLRKTHECLNCHETIGDYNYCPNCGQINTDKQVPFRYFIEDVLGDFFTFDSRFFRSFLPLIRRPGFLTNEYISGKRVSYIFPFRMYLFVSFLFFFSLTLSSKISSDDDKNVETNSDKRINELQDTLAFLKPGLNQLEIDRIVGRVDSSFILRSRETNLTISTVKDDSGKTWIGKYLNKKAKSLKAKGDMAGEIFLRELVNQIPKVMFIILPLFALLLKLLYIRKGIYYINHFIFSLHLHTVLFLSLIILILWPAWYMFLIVSILNIVYGYKAFRNVYRQSRLKTVLKLGLLSVMYFVVLIGGVIMTGLLTLVSI
jgi:hypothetical protein